MELNQMRLLQKKQQTEKRTAEPLSDIRQQGDLLQRISRMSPCGVLPQTEQETPPVCPDGYQRRSPVQPYQTMPGYRQKMIRRAVLYGALGLLVVLAVWALFNSGLMRF